MRTKIEQRGLDLYNSLRGPMSQMTIEEMDNFKIKLEGSKEEIMGCMECAKANIESAENMKRAGVDMNWEAINHYNNLIIEACNNAVNKEENKMKKFEIAGIEYKYNTETGRYSKTENGKTKRIGKAEYEEAASKPMNIKTIPCESGDHAVEFAKFGADYGVRFVGEEEYHMMDRSEIHSRVDSRTGDQKYYASFEFMGRRYWTKDAIVKGETKKAKRSSRSKKNVAYRKQFGDMEITLTEKQVDFFHHMQDTCFWEQGLDSSPWIDVLCDEIGGQFENKPMTVGAMVSTLREKGLLDVVVERVNGRKAKYFALTPSGKDVARDLGLK